jgi:uncharacterized protein (TIGR03067 family)
MTARLLVVVFVIQLASGVNAGGDKKDDKKDDKDALQGEWTVVSMEASGKAIEPKGNLVIKGSDWTAPNGGKLTFKIDSTKSPKQLDLAGPKKAAEWQGIYKIEGDKLTFCRPLVAGGERPTEFKGGDGIVLMECKRAGK